MEQSLKVNVNNGSVIRRVISLPLPKSGLPWKSRKGPWPDLIQQHCPTSFHPSVPCPPTSHTRFSRTYLAIIQKKCLFQFVLLLPRRLFCSSSYSKTIEGSIQTSGHPSQVPSSFYTLYSGSHIIRGLCHSSEQNKNKIRVCVWFGAFSKRQHLRSPTLPESWRVLVHI